MQPLLASRFKRGKEVSHEGTKLDVLKKQKQICLKIDAYNNV